MITADYIYAQFQLAQPDKNNAALQCVAPREIMRRQKHFYVELFCLNELALLMKEQSFFKLRLDRRCKWFPRLRDLLRCF